MKITDAHYKILRARVLPHMPQYPFLIEQYKRVPKIKSAEAAALWRVYHMARIYDVFTYQEWDYLDAHIETAMRKIIRDAGQVLPHAVTVEGAK